MANLSNINNKFLVQTGGNVGIGTTSPTQLLHVNSSTNNPTGIGLQNSERYYAVRSNNYSLVFSDETVGSERMRIDSSGNVGIGTASPPSDHKLQIHNAGAAYARFALTNTSTGVASADGLIFQMETLNSIIKNQEAGYLTFGTSGRETDLHIDSDGDVGIGTVPSRRLDVRDSSDTQNTILAYNQGASFTGTVYEAITDRTSNSAFNLMNLKSSTVSKFLVRGDGHVGIGTISPDTTLDVYAGASDVQDTILWGSQIKNEGNGTATNYGAGLKFKNSSIAEPYKWSGIAGVAGAAYSNSTDLAFYVSTNSTADAIEEMRIKGNGYVGIGTNNPSEKLSVYDGNISINNSHSFMVGGATGDTIIGRLGNTSGVLNLQAESTRSIRLGNVSQGELVRIDAYNRKVGIGTTSPQELLDVNTNITGLNVDNTVAIFGNDVGTTQSRDTWIKMRASAATNDYTWAFGTQQAGDFRFNYLGTRATAPTSGSTFVTITNTGKVGIGKAPTQTLSIQAATYPYIDFWEGATGRGDLGYNTSTGSFTLGAYAAVPMAFYTNSAERMRISSDGNVLIGITAQRGKLTINSSATSGYSNALGIYAASDGGTYNFAQFLLYGTSTLVGSITSNGTVTAYNVTSDYRLKEDLQDFNGLDKVSKIPVYDFKWKVDENRSYGVMAHELQEVLPQAVVGEKDAEEMQQVDYSKIVPLLVKSIQELKAEIDVLKSK